MPKARFRRRRTGRETDRWTNCAPDVPANFQGRAVMAGAYRHNGRLRFSLRDFDPFCGESGTTVFELGLPMSRYRSATFARYRAEGRCSAAELRTIEALWLDGLTLRAFAVREGVSPQAIGSRINALANKAPEFYRWWRSVNASRQRPRKGGQESKGPKGN